MAKFEKVLDRDVKSEIADDILRTLPQWFGLEASIVEYVEEVRNTDFFVAYKKEKPVGFISIKYNNDYTSEIYVMGILMEHQNMGIGKKLLKLAESELTQKNIKFIMVKTLGDSHPDTHYNQTREFYKSAGFYPLEEIREIWGKDNPCLIMVKAI